MSFWCAKNHCEGLPTRGSPVLRYALTLINKKPRQLPSFSTNTFEKKKRREGKKHTKRITAGMRILDSFWSSTLFNQLVFFFGLATFGGF